MSVFNKHRGTEQDVLEELKILATSDHHHILRYYHSWSEPSEYHKEHDKILFDQSEISRSMTSTRGENQTQLGTVHGRYLHVEMIIKHNWAKVHGRYLHVEMIPMI